MTPTDTAQRVTTAVYLALQGALELEPDEITPGATILEDLGAESIDLLDLRFRLEKDLNLHITNEDLVKAFQGAETAAQFRKAFTVEAMIAYLVGRLEKGDG